MPNSSRVPNTSSVQFFENTMTGHSEVQSIVKRDENIYVINRNRYAPIVVYLTDIYTIGIADVINAKEQIPDLGCIVTISNWNGYTRQAKEYGIENLIGVFQCSEFMGAVNRSEIWGYAKKDEDGNPTYRYQR